MRGVLASAVLFTLLVTLASTPAVAQTSSWATVNSVRDITGNVTLAPGASLVAGDTYNVTLTVSVPFTVASSQFQLTLNTLMNRSGSQFWYVLTPKYAGYNASSFTGGQPMVTFNQVKGNLTVSAVFTVPADFTTSKFDTLTLHTLRQGFAVVFVNVSGSQLGSAGEVTMNISDQAIQRYLNDYQTKSTLISSGMIDPAYSNIVNSELSQAQNLYSSGLAEQADQLLQTIVPSNFPAPPNSTFVNYLLIGLVVAAVLAVVFLVLLLRSRGKSGFYDSIASEVQKELAALEVTAAQYDQSLADRLKRLRDRLGERL
jgi:hypothetical protein